MKQLSKVKVMGNNEKINILFTDYQDDHTLIHQITGDEQARPEFYKALEALNLDVLAILDLPVNDEFLNRIHVYGVSFRRINKESSQVAAVISVKLDVPGADTCIAINTPVKKYPQDEVDEKDTVHFFTKDTVTALKNLEAETMAYIDGKRAQMSLFEDQDDEDEDHETEAQEETTTNDVVIPFSASL